MNFSIDFTKPEIKSVFDWQLSQEVNVINEHGDVVAKAELDIITLNKHRGADESYALLIAQDATDWEVPLNVYFNKQNIVNDLAEKLSVKVDAKAKQHILLEAISVLPKYRGKGLARMLLAAIAEQYAKAQSISVLSMPMSLFVDLNDCDDDSYSYYQQMNLTEDNTQSSQLADFFQHVGFIDVGIDDSALDEPLPFKVFISSASHLLKSD